MVVLTAILIVNAGSSSLKLRVLDESDSVAGSADLPPPRGADDAAAIKAAIEPFGDMHAVGHRIVHGGDLFSGPVLIGPGVREQLRALTDLAPLHQPKSLDALDAVSAVLPDVPAVACFDTAFHATIPAAAATFALPAEWRERWPLRRFGFHGLSHAYVSQPETEHPHGMPDAEFDAMFSVGKPVIFAYHGYPWLIHRLTYSRHGHDNLHVRGYKEEGTTTTPFDMVMRNDLDRYHLVMDVIDRVPGLSASAGRLRQDMADKRIAFRAYTREYGDDAPEVRDWKWTY